MELARSFFRSKVLWKEFKKVQLEILHREAECSDDEGDVDFDGEEGLSCDAQGKPQAKKGVEVIDISVHTWGLYVLLDTRSAGAKEPAN